MTCGGCACNTGGEAPGEEPLLEAEKGRPWGRTTTEGPAEGIPLVKKAADRAIKFIARGLLILLWLYLFNSMRTYAISYVGEDTWFSTFAAIAVGVPIAEIFCILGQNLVMLPYYLPIESSMPCSACEAPRDELDAPFLDLEKGPRAPLQADAMLKMAAMAGLPDASALDMAEPRIGKCIIRGLLVLLWVYLVDLMRRYVTTHSVEELIFTIGPLGFLGVGMSVFICFLMESFSECIPSPT